MSGPTTSSSTARPTAGRCGCSRSSTSTRGECLSIDVGRRLNSEHVLARLAELFVRRGVPEYIRSDNGPEFTAKAVRRWLPRVGVQTLFIEPGSPWGERLRGVLQRQAARRAPHVELFDTLLEAQVLTERWRCEYNQLRPHSSLGYRPPAAGGHTTAAHAWTARARSGSNLGSGTNGGGRSVVADLGVPTFPPSGSG